MIPVLDFNKYIIPVSRLEELTNIQFLSKRLTAIPLFIFNKTIITGPCPT
jgi:hypothetical protein